MASGVVRAALFAVECDVDCAVEYAVELAVECAVEVRQTSKYITCKYIQQCMFGFKGTLIICF